MHNAIHATAVVFDGLGMLLIGPSGSGKSDLALRLIDQGGTLISDDQTILSKEEQKLIASPPPNIKGLLEIRHIGIVPHDFVENVEIHLIISLQDYSNIPRYPEIHFEELEGIKLPLFYLDPFTISALAKVRTLCRIIEEEKF
jgi:serine kinase of HPr protein (carbohydrate metabolism regulator)